MRNKKYTNILTGLFATVSLLVPTFYLTTSSTFFEFNKITLTSSFVVILLLVWAAKLLSEKEVFVIKTPLNLPILMLIASFTLASFFSVNKTISLFGQYGRWFPSLFAILLLVLFYYALAHTISNTQQIATTLYSFLGGITINATVAILSYLGIYFGAQTYLNQPNFNLVGSTTVTAVLSAIAFSMAIGCLLHQTKTPYKLILLQVSVINLIALAFLNVNSAWFVLIIGISSVLALTPGRLAKLNSPYLLVVFGLCITVAGLSLFPQTQDYMQNPALIKELRLPANYSWVIASSTVTDYPWLGTGPSTFNLNYTAYKPVAVNSTDFWNVRFDRPYNEFFHVLSTVGLVGFVAFAFFLYRALKLTMHIKNKLLDETGVQQTLVIGLISTVSALFFTYLTFPLAFSLFLLLGLVTARAALEEKKVPEISKVKISLASMEAMPLMGLTENVDKKETFQYLGFLVLIVLSGVLAFYTYRFYVPEYYARKAAVAFTNNDAVKTYEYQARAIQANPLRSEYRNTYARTNLLLASNLAQREELTDNDIATVQQFVTQAINQSRISTEVLNSRSAVSWEIRAEIYRALIGAADNADQWALASYTNAIQNDPLNPRLRLATGGIYYATQNYLAAATAFRQATGLKPDYANAHYNLALSLEQLGNYDLAAQEMAVVQRLVPEGSSDYQIATTKLQELQDQVQQQINTSALPSVEQLEQQGQIEEQGQITNQEPLTQEGDLDTILVGEEVQLEAQETEDGRIEPTNE